MGEQRDDVTMRSARECKTGRLSRPCISHCRVQPSSPRQEAGQPALARYRLGWLVRSDGRGPSTESRVHLVPKSQTPKQRHTTKGRTPAAGAKAAAEATREARMQVFILGIGAAFILSKVARPSWYATYAGELGGFPF